MKRSINPINKQAHPRSIPMAMLKLLCALVYISFCTGGYSQNFGIDLAELGNGSHQISGPGLEAENDNSEAQTYGLSESGTCFLTLTVEGHDIATVRFDVDESNEVSNVSWKPASPDAPLYSTLGGNFFELYEELDGLRLFSGTFLLDLSHTDVAGVSMSMLAPSNILPGDTVFEYKGFPGFYQVNSPFITSRLGFTYDDNGLIAPKTWMKDLDHKAAPWELLHADFYQLNGNCFSLLSKPIVLEHAGFSMQEHFMDCFVSGKKQIAASGGVATRMMFPGMYVAEVKESGVTVAKVRLKLQNQTGQLSTVVEWFDPITNRTKGGYEALETGSYHVEQARLGISSVMPPPPFSATPGPFALLREVIDGSYYVARQGQLWFRYDERYNTQTDLNFRILDMDYQEIQLLNPISRDYGTNWVKLTLPPTDFSIGDFYVLEVHGPKGDRSMLKFRFE